MKNGPGEEDWLTSRIVRDCSSLEAVEADYARDANEATYGKDDAQGELLSFRDLEVVYDSEGQAVDEDVLEYVQGCIAVVQRCLIEAGSPVNIFVPRKRHGMALEDVGEDGSDNGAGYESNEYIDHYSVRSLRDQPEIEQ